MDQNVKTIEMKRADWEKWDTALRSGKYRQGIGLLESNGSYCCLGVLQHCLAGDVERNPNGRSLCYPTREWLDEHGIESTANPYLPMLGLSASEANDGGTNLRHTFEQIADAIADAVKFTD